MAARIAAARDPEHAAKLLDAWATDAADRHDVAGLMFAPQAMADMAGQLFVRSIEVPESTRKLDAARPPTFLDMPFREAVEFFRARYPDDSDALDGILDAYRRRSAEGAEILVRRLNERAQEALRRAIEDGVAMRDFAATLADGTAELGIEPATPSYVETVFRTQVATAYGAGRVRQIMHPAVVEARPIVEYLTVRDNRVRPNHAALHGLQFTTTDPEWLRIAPPNGFSCRCGMVTRDREDIDPERMRSTVPPEGEPDEGFDGPPTDLVDEPIGG